MVQSYFVMKKSMIALIGVTALATVGGAGQGKLKGQYPIEAPPQPTKKYPEVRANASKLVKLMVKKDVSKDNWMLDEEKTFMTFRAPGHSISFRMSEKSLLSYNNMDEIRTRQRTRPLQTDKFKEDAKWKAHAVGLAHKIWPGIPLEMAKIERTGEKGGTGNFWYEQSNLVSIHLHSKKPDGKYSVLSLQYDRGTGTLLSLLKTGLIDPKKKKPGTISPPRPPRPGNPG